ncbi:SDR family oxidoreductase [Streptomyces ipomoeae]|uniref:SDR family oxidoreductase n=1 Tax=Streptomyces ipomoeae TaxID=103232 RepID=A0AAE8W6G5_9ACTN|nr:UDP-glucuronic acid decarboxylase family protein [Streptomyces ipomoeae]TQE38927.1 SDR family oxidoreductase [Streptomyces ipomoeae]
MRAVVTGGSGFLGSHMCEALLRRGDMVWCLDNHSTGEARNVAHLVGHPRFTLVRSDVTAPFDVPGPVDAVVHLASPASPPDYGRMPLETLSAGSRGTENCLLLALRRRARFLLASTSEVYGDPAVHPQPEGYWGNVNPVGPRSVYDEAKRYAEALTTAYRNSRGVDTGIVRIFNTYGPRMRPHDGRVVSTFVRQALAGAPLTVYGDGSQTRSFCYVDDLVRGLTAMLDSPHPGPVNLGNPAEYTVRRLATLVLEVTGSPSAIDHRPLPVDDPTRRRPDIGKARSLLGWAPEVPLETGLRRTAAWFTRSVAPAFRDIDERVEA